LFKEFVKVVRLEFPDGRAVCIKGEGKEEVIFNFEFLVLNGGRK
jgi:hypothetical protein